MLIPKRILIEKELKKERRSLAYYQKRNSDNLIDNDQFLLKISPITRSIDILEFVLIAYDCKESLDSIIFCHLNFKELPSPENYFIHQLSNEFNNMAIETNMLEFENLGWQTKLNMVDIYKSFQRDLKRLKLNDSFQEIIDSIGFDGNNI